MKLINAIVKSMDWSIKTKKSQLLKPKNKISSIRDSSEVMNIFNCNSNNKELLMNTEVSNNELKVSDYFSLDTESSRHRGDPNETLNLGLLLRKLQILRHILKKILNDLNNLLIFHDRTYCNICIKCREFAYNDHTNRLETFDIIDTLIQSLGVNAMFKNQPKKSLENSSNTLNNSTTKSTVSEIELKENELCLDETSDSSEEIHQVSNESDFQTNTAATSTEIHTPYRLPFRNTRVTKNTHNFRCELILFLSMLRDIICSLYDLSASSIHQIQSFINLPTTGRQIQKMKQEYLVILNYVTELIEGPKYQPRKRKIRRNYRAIIIKLKLNILVSKKHIFEILYEMCKIKKLMKKHQTDCCWQKSESCGSLPSVSSQVLVKIHDICSKLKESNAIMDSIKKTKAANIQMRPPREENSNREEAAEDEVISSEGQQEDEDILKYEFNRIKATLAANVREMNSISISKHLAKEKILENKPMKQNYPKLETDLQTNPKIIDKKRKLLQMIYKLLEEYLKSSKNEDLEKIKQFIEKQTFKYGIELEKIYTEEDRIETILLKKGSTQLKKTPSSSGAERVGQTSCPIQQSKERFKIDNCMDEEKRNSERNEPSPENYSTEKDHAEEIQQNPESLRTDPRFLHPSQITKVYKKHSATTQIFVGENFDVNSKSTINQKLLTNNTFNQFGYLNKGKKKIDKTDRLRNCYTDDDYGDTSKQTNKELLQELKRLEIIVYCLQNKKNKVEMNPEKSKLTGELAQHTQGSDSHFLEHSQTEKHSKLREFGTQSSRQELNEKLHEIYGTMSYMEIMKNSKNILSQNTGSHPKDELKFFESKNTYDQFQENDDSTNRYSPESNNLNKLSLAQDVFPSKYDNRSLNQSDNCNRNSCETDETNDEIVLQTIDYEKHLCEKSEEVTKVKSGLKGENTTEVRKIDFETKKKSQSKRVIKSKSDICTLKTKPSIENENFEGQYKINILIRNGDTSEEIDTHKFYNSTKNIKSTSYEKIIKKDQGMSINNPEYKLKKSPIPKTLNFQNRKEKSSKYRRKKSTLIMSKNTQNTQKELLRNSPKQSEIRLDKGIEKTENNYKKYALKSITSENHCRIPDISNDFLTTSHLYGINNDTFMINNSDSLKNIQTRYVDRKWDLLNKSRFYNKNRAVDCTSSKIMQNCMNLISSGKSNFMFSNNSNNSIHILNKNLPSTSNLPKENKEHYDNNKKNLTALYDNFHCTDKITKKSVCSRTKLFVAENLQSEENWKTFQKFLHPNTKVEPSELTTLFTFENLINTKNKSEEQLHGQLTANDDIYSSSSSAVVLSNSDFIKNLEKNRSESRKDDCNRENSEASITFQSSSDCIITPELSTTKCEYVRAKIDSLCRKNLQANSFSGSQMIIPSYVKNEVLNQSKVLKGSNDPFTNVYMNCLFGKNNSAKNMDQTHKRRNSNDFSTPELQTKQSITKIDRKNNSQVTREGFSETNEYSAINDLKIRASKRTLKTLKTKVKTMERNKRLKKPFHKKKNKSSNSNQTITLTPTTIDLMTELLLPKAHLTKCVLKNKMYANELQQEVSTDYIRYKSENQLATPTALRSDSNDTCTSFGVKLTEEMKKDAQHDTLKFSAQRVVSDTKTPKKTIINPSAINSQRFLQVYDCDGLPLTNSRGDALVDASGQILIRFDKNNKPISDLKNNLIFDAANISSNDINFNPYTKPKENPFKIQLTNEEGKPLILYNERGHPLTDNQGYSLHNIIGDPLIRFDSCGRPISDCKGVPLLPQHSRELKAMSQKDYIQTSTGVGMQGLTSTTTNSIQYRSDSLSSQDRISDEFFDLTTQKSLAVSSTRSSEVCSNFSAKNNFKEIDYLNFEENEIELTLKDMTEDNNLSSETLSISDCETKVTDTIATSSDNLCFSPPKEQNKHLSLDCNFPYYLNTDKSSSDDDKIKLQFDDDDSSQFMKSKKKMSYDYDIDKLLNRLYGIDSKDERGSINTAEVKTYKKSSDSDAQGKKIKPLDFCPNDEKIMDTNFQGQEQNTDFQYELNLKTNQIENEETAKNSSLLATFETATISTLSDIIPKLDKTPFRVQSNFKVNNNPDSKTFSTLRSVPLDRNDYHSFESNIDLKNGQNKRKSKLNSTFTITNGPHKKVSQYIQEDNDQSSPIFKETSKNNFIGSQYKSNCGDSIAKSLNKSQDIFSNYIQNEDFLLKKKQVQETVADIIEGSYNEKKKAIQDELNFAITKDDVVKKRFSKPQKKLKTIPELRQKQLEKTSEKPNNSQLSYSNISKKINEFSCLLDLRKFLRKNKSSFTKKSDFQLLDFRTLKKFLNEQFSVRNDPELLLDSKYCKSKSKVYKEKEPTQKLLNTQNKEIFFQKLKAVKQQFDINNLEREILNDDQILIDSDSMRRLQILAKNIELKKNAKKFKGTYKNRSQRKTCKSINATNISKKYKKLLASEPSKNYLQSTTEGLEFKDNVELINFPSLKLTNRGQEKDFKRQLYMNRMRDSIIYENPIGEELERYLFDENTTKFNSKDKLTEKTEIPPQYSDYKGKDWSNFLDSSDDFKKEGSFSCIDSIEFMNEIFNSIIEDKSNKIISDERQSYNSWTSEHKDLTQLSETLEHTPTEYSEQMGRAFDPKSERILQFDMFNRPLNDKWNRPLFDKYGRPLYDLFTRPIYDKYGQPYTDAFGNVLMTSRSNEYNYCKPLCGEEFEYIEPAVLEKILSNKKHGPIKDPFGGPLFTEDGIPLYNKYGKPLYNINGKPIYNIYGQPCPVHPKKSQPTKKNNAIL